MNLKQCLIENEGKYTDAWIVDSDGELINKVSIDDNTSFMMELIKVDSYKIEDRSLKIHVI